MDRSNLENAIEELESEKSGLKLDRSSGLSQIAISDVGKFEKFCKKELPPQNLMGWMGE